MNYQQYIELQNRVEWLHDFHPDFFDQLEPQERGSLQKGLLYDMADADYPESIKDFYEKSIAHDEKLQADMFKAAQKLYDLSGSGELNLDDTVHS